MLSVPDSVCEYTIIGRGDHAHVPVPAPFRGLASGFEWYRNQDFLGFAALSEGGRERVAAPILE